LGMTFVLYHTVDVNYASVNAIQKGLLWQAVPAYLFGLYTDVPGRAVLIGTSFGGITCLILISVLFTNNGALDPFPLVDKSWSTFMSVAVNVIITAIAHFMTASKRIESLDSTDILSLAKIEDVMRGISEPIKKWNGVLVLMTFALSLFGVFHWIGRVDPDLIDEYGREYAESLMYNGQIRNVIGGVPDYFLMNLLWIAVAIMTGIVATLQWDTSQQSKHTVADAMDDVDSGKTKTEMAELTTNGRVDNGFTTETDDSHQSM